MAFEEKRTWSKEILPDLRQKSFVLHASTVAPAAWQAVVYACSAWHKAAWSPLAAQTSWTQWVKYSRGLTRGWHARNGPSASWMMLQDPFLPYFTSLVTSHLLHMPSSQPSLHVLSFSGTFQEVTNSWVVPASAPLGSRKSSLGSPS